MPSSGRVSAGSFSPRPGHLPGTGGLRAVISAEEVRLWSLKLLTVEEDVDLLVIEGDHPGDGQQLAGGKVVSPGQVPVHGVTGADRPVAARSALIRARGDGVGGD